MRECPICGLGKLTGEEVCERCVPRADLSRALAGVDSAMDGAMRAIRGNPDVPSDIQLTVGAFVGMVKEWTKKVDRSVG